MKKYLLLLALSPFAAQPMLAQDEEDMTQYIINAGFDEDLTWNADGSKKGPQVRQTSLSNRSNAYVTEDGSLYATVASTTDKSRADGRTFEATNGFVGQIKGWEWVTPREGDKCEWVYFGTLPYDLQAESIPIADDGTTYMTVPERPTEFDGGTGALYLRAGWGNSFSYKQEVKLPCAEYRLEYWTININPNTTATATDLSKITCRRDVFQEEGGTALTATEWTKHEFTFTPVDKFTIEFGFKAGNGGSGSTPWVYVDGIKLYKVGEADPADLLTEDMYYYISRIEGELQDSLVGVNGDYFYGLSDESFALSEQYTYNGDDLAQLQESINQLKALFDTMMEAAETAKRVEALYLKAQNILAATDYPNKAALTAYCEDLYKLLYTDGKAADILAAEEATQKAINDYYFSQPAAFDEPANYSFLLASPWFCKDGREPADGTAAAVNAAALTNNDRYVDAAWQYVGNASNVQYGSYFKVGRTCYQLWADNNFTGTLKMQAQLTDLPNGIYSLSMDLITNTDALSDQHVFAASSLGETEGYMTEAGVCYEWPSGDYTGGYPADGSEPWETVTTKGTVIVVDGKLTIGAASTHGDAAVEDISSGYRRGSFWMTNVVLRYHGAATDEQIAAAAAARLQKATDLAAAMHFAADKKAVNDSIAAYNTTKNLTVLNNGIALAETSEAKYAEILEDGKTLPTVAKNLAEDAEGTYGVALDIVKYANDAVLAWLASDAATYTQIDNKLNQMKAYVNTYAQTAIEVNEAVRALRSSTAKETLATALAAHKERLLVGDNELLSVSKVEEMAEALKRLQAVAEAQDAYERNPEATDYTGWILNPNFAATTGWTMTVVNGNGPINSGQYFTGDTDYKYFDSYSTSGLDVTGEQVVEGLPNGTYQAKACVRTPAVGAFIFAAVGETKADSIFVEIPVLTYTYTDPVTEKDTTVVASDKYGPIWEEAMAAYQAGTATPEQEAIAFVNGNIGRGWQWLTIDNIVVTDHKLTIGQTCSAGRSGKAFEGDWFSVTDWSLTLISKGDNEGWNGPITGVNDLQAAAPAATDGIYTLDGRRVSQATRGLYIVVRGGKARKVLVK